MAIKVADTAVESRLTIASVDRASLEFRLGDGGDAHGDAAWSFGEYEISPSRVELATASVFRSNPRFVRNVQASGELSIELELANPISRSLNEMDEDDVREERPSVGAYVRPFFLGPPNLSKLHAYQQAGVDFLLGRRSAILADDMGLGKTVQAVSAIQTLVRSAALSTALILAPKSLLLTWSRELDLWAPELAHTVLRIRSGSDREAVWRALLGRYHVVVTNYDSFNGGVPKGVSEWKFGLVVLDEAHRVRRQQASLTRSVRSLNRTRRWALSGTPIERDLADLATLLSVVDPLRFTADDAQAGRARLRARARPLILRRTKAEVLSALPRVAEFVEWIELGPRQRSRYENAIDSMRKQGAQAQSLTSILELRSICDMDPETGESTKLSAIKECLLRVAEDGEKAIVFSYSLAPLRALSAMLREENLRQEYVDGEMDTDARQQIFDRFKADLETVALLASSRVASEGLTLVEANHVFFLNEWWNPSNNDQARDRVVRIGQQRPVFVRKFRAIGTVDQRLAELLSEKRALAEEVLSDPSTVASLLADC